MLREHEYTIKGKCLMKMRNACRVIMREYLLILKATLREKINRMMYFMM